MPRLLTSQVKEQRGRLEESAQEQHHDLWKEAKTQPKVADILVSQERHLVREGWRCETFS